MRFHTLRATQFIPRPLHEVFSFFADAANLERITPPWLGFRILTPGSVQIHTGALIDYEIRWHNLPIRWRTQIRTWQPEFRFSDVQLRGPYALWHHTHTFRAVQNGTQMMDLVRYRLPFGILGEIAHVLQVRREVNSIFAYRRKVIEDIFPPPR